MGWSAGWLGMARECRRFRPNQWMKAHDWNSDILSGVSCVHVQHRQVSPESFILRLINDSIALYMVLCFPLEKTLHPTPRATWVMFCHQNAGCARGVLS